MDHSDRMADSRPDKSEQFALRTFAVYLSRLLENHQLEDSMTIKLLAWILGPEKTALETQLLSQMSQRERRKFGIELNETTIDDLEETADTICRTLKRAGKKRTANFLVSSRNLLERRYKSLAYFGRSAPEKKLSVLAKMFNLTKQEKAFCTFLPLHNLCLATGRELLRRSSAMPEHIRQAVSEGNPADD